MALFAILIVCGLFVEITCFDYCSVSGSGCSGGMHTMCKYEKGKVGCSGDKVKTGLNNEQRRAILDLHNALRQKVAQGKQHPQPAASNMRKMHWDNEVEAIAQRWADQCKFAHDSCRSLSDGTSSGQNIALSHIKLKEGANRTSAVEYAVTLWYDEVNDTDPTVIDNFVGVTNSQGKLIGHYTALVSAASSRLGCGYVEKQPESDWFQPFILVCNYSPSGNLLNSPIYKTGEACSACPKGARCSKKWPGLCTSEKDEYEDIPPSSRAAGNDLNYSIKLFVTILVCSYSKLNLLNS